MSENMTIQEAIERIELRMQILIKFRGLIVDKSYADKEIEADQMALSKMRDSVTRVLTLKDLFGLAFRGPEPDRDNSYISERPNYAFPSYFDRKGRECILCVSTPYHRYSREFPYPNNLYLDVAFAMGFQNSSIICTRKDVYYGTYGKDYRIWVGSKPTAEQIANTPWEAEG